MTAKKNVEIELIKEQLKKLIYAQESSKKLLHDLIAEHERLAGFIQDTKATLNYVKTYIGCDDFFDEVRRHGKGSENGRIE